MNCLTLKIISLISFVIVVTGCAPDIAASATITITRVAVVTATNTAVSSPSPATTPTTVISPTPETAPTPTATNTPLIVPTPTPIFYDLPTWVSNPTMDVLLLQTMDRQGRNKAATLFNAQTGERFDIPMFEYASPRWTLIGSDLYFDLGTSLSAIDSPLMVHQIQATTGQLIEFEDQRIFTPGIRKFPSPDGRYLIHIVEDENVPAIATLINQETGEEIKLLDPFNGAYADGLDVAWSPNGQLIGIERFRRVDDSTASYGVRIEPALAIFSLDGTKLVQYSNLDYDSLSWSPSLPYRILYPAYGLYNEPPCILEVMTSDYNCLGKVAQWRDEQQVEIGNYEWSPDGSKVGFIYWGPWGSSNSGFCYIELATDSITCPITRDTLQVDEYLERFGQGGVAYVYLRDYQWSPSGQYIALGISPGLPTGDDGTFDTLAIANAAGELLWIILDGKLDYNNPWRPPIPSQSEE